MSSITERVVVAVLFSAAFIGVTTAFLDARRNADFTVHSFAVKHRFRVLRADLTNVDRVGYLTDRVDKTGQKHYYVAQYELVPTVLEPQPHLPDLLRELRRGYRVICDFRSADLLQRQIEAFDGEAKKYDLTVTIRRYSPTLLILSTVTEPS